MESLIKQARVRFSSVGQENKEETVNIRDRKIPRKKTQSFKGEKKKLENWFQTQFSRQMSQDYDSSNDGEYPAAVAAAAFAINSLEELRHKDHKNTSEGLETSLTKIKSKTEDTTSRVPETGKISRRLSGDISITSAEVPDTRVSISVGTNEKISEKAVGPMTSMKKSPSFADKSLNSTGSIKPESDIRRQSSTRPGIGNNKADTWERTEMAKIKERYEKLNAAILDSEKKKVAKAKSRIDRTESELERRRAKALQYYRSEMERINRIAGGARRKAEESRRKEEFKVKEKANKIRSTGKIPATCLCF